MEKDMKNLTKSVELIAKTTATILERVGKIEDVMAKKDDLKKIEKTVLATRDELNTLKDKVNLFKLDSHVNFNDIRTDLKILKQETRDNFEEVNTKLDNLNDTDMNFDKRIEKIEEKVLI